MAVSKNRRLLVASLSSALALPLVLSSAPAQAGETVHCYGVNKCKGTGDCGGKGRSCAGTNECKRAGYIDMDEDTCLRLDGGRLTEEPQPEDKAEKEDKKG